MTLLNIFWHPEVRTYKSALISKASFFIVCCIVLTFIAPLLSVYSSYGFWKKEYYYTEQPTVRFNYQAILTLSTISKEWIWSTSTNLNALRQVDLMATQVKVQEYDSNSDGKNEWMLIQFQSQLPSTENIIAAKLILLFDYQLTEVSKFEMQCMAYIDYSNMQPGDSLTAIGHLSFKQKTPLKSKGTDLRYNTSIVPMSSAISTDYQFSRILLDYQKRNVSTMFDSALYSWEPNRMDGRPFKLNVTVYYPPARVIFLPSFWLLIKWAWVQYVPLLIVFLLVFDRIKVFTFQNQIIGTLVQRPNILSKEHAN